MTGVIRDNNEMVSRSTIIIGVQSREALSVWFLANATGYTCVYSDAERATAADDSSAARVDVSLSTTSEVIDLAARNVTNGNGGTAPFTRAGQVRVQNNGTDTVILGETDGDLPNAELVIRVADGAAVLAEHWCAADFLL